MRNQDPYFGLHQPVPLKVLFFGGRSRSEHNEVLVQGEEVGGLEELWPGALSVEDLVDHGEGALEAVAEDGAGGVGDVESGVLVGVGGRDNGHQVEAVAHVHLRRYRRSLLFMCNESRQLWSLVIDFLLVLGTVQP